VCLRGLDGRGTPAEVVDRLAADRGAVGALLDRARSDGLAVVVRVDLLRR
jgi:hypothetical protein